MMSVAGVAAAALFASASLIACSSRSLEPTVDMSIVKADLTAVSHARILFAHQSVGRNILDGVRALATEANVPIRIEEATGKPMSAETGLFHVSIGENGDPSGKIAAFQRLLADPRRPSYDIAVLKFCYVDLASDARDRDRLLERYSAAVAELRAARPDVRLVHVTSPLRSEPTGWKAAVNRLFGRVTEEDADNAFRNNYNVALVSRFSGEPVFDLAKVESTRADGTRTNISRGGAAIYTMAPEYTSDGGHLNDQGRRVAAAQFLCTLARALKRHGTSTLTRNSACLSANAI